MLLNTNALVVHIVAFDPGFVTLFGSRYIIIPIANGHRMAFIKSFVVGIMALVVAVILFVWIYFAVLIRPKLHRGGLVGIDPRSFLRSVQSWLVAIVAFAVGFYWEFRRASR